MYWWRRNNKGKGYSRGWSRGGGEVGVGVEIEVSHGQGVKSSEMKSSEVNVLPHPLSSKRMQACLQRFICSEVIEFEVILKKLLRIICELLNYLLNLVCNWVMRNENIRFSR